MIFQHLTEQLNQLEKLLQRISPAQYTTPIQHLSGATIGGHARHIIELLRCLENGYAQGQIDYTHRTRDLRLESQKDLAIANLHQSQQLLTLPDKSLLLLVPSAQQESKQVMTSFYREIVYHTEHALHHLALIKTATIELGIDGLDDAFGVAYATLQYRAAQAALPNDQNS